MSSSASSPIVLAIDAGASSMRVVAVDAADPTEVVELHRIANAPQQQDGQWRWDLEALWAGVEEGLRQGVERYGERIKSIGADTWGVDYVLIDKNGQESGGGICYRDERTEGLIEASAEKVDPRAWWGRTGIRPMVFNTAFQMMAHLRDAPDELNDAAGFLFMPDWFHFRLCGVAANEWTIASTSQLALADGSAWDMESIKALGLPEHLFGELTQSGTILGPLKPELLARVGWPEGAQAPVVVAPAGHDTGSAFACVEDPTPGDVIISCGTWALLGRITDPCTTDAGWDSRFSNELAHNGKTRLLSNIMGTWVLQELRKAMNWEWDDVAAAMAAADQPPLPLDVDDARFFGPHSDADPYPERLKAWYAEKGHDITDPGALALGIEHGLAKTLAAAAEEIAALTGTPLDRIHLVGGGGKDPLLVKLLGQYSGREIVVGATEATAIGNAKIQLQALAP